MIDAASGGSLDDKTTEAARNLISIMANASQQYGGQEPTRRANEVGISSLESKLSQLTSLVQTMVTGSMQQVRACGICTNTRHSTDMCPTLYEDTMQNVNAIGGFPGPPQRKYDPYSNTYNPGW